ncbi:hypothetical protein ACS127_05450 [Amphibacillus sp. Q70]|uniref:hypothetical protein n=1 Tax=Amphibacillus sp. Q70 TaxID=3453416 RepID=UPI003F87A183
MNYRDFMKQVDEQLSNMSDEEKDNWIRDIARTTREKKRQFFLHSLMNKEKYVSILPDDTINEIGAWCEKIENQDIYIECTGYETYEAGYYGEWVDEYEDVFGIGEELSKAFQIARDLLYLKQYKQSQALFERLCSLEFQAVDVMGGDGHVLELEGLIAEGLVNISVKDTLLHLMYATYQSYNGKERVNMLYRYFLSWYVMNNMTVEEIFIIGPEELKGISEFMEEWISLLKKKDGDLAGRLLTEACLYLGGVNYLINIARSNSKRHPCLYKNACEILLREAKFAQCEEVGLEAIRQLSEKLVMRGEIADLAAEAARQLKHPEVIKTCYQAAFYAESTLAHYLRLFELPLYDDITKRAAIYANALPENSELSYSERKNIQLQLNSLSKENKKAIDFFNQEFDKIIDLCQKNKTVLGWSTHFKGLLVPLFILLMNKSNQLTVAGNKLLDNIVIRLGYRNEQERFLEQFIYWKEKIVITDQEAKKYINWLQKEVDKRTEAVVSGGFRNSYYKPAALIVALGEAMESFGDLGCKEDLIEYYKKKHSRKSAFKAELSALD